MVPAGYLGRGGMKKSELRSDPDKTRAWQDRSRKPLGRGTPKKRVSVPAGVRNKVRTRSGGWCVACLARNGIFATNGNLPREYRVPTRIMGARGDIRPIAHLHHVLPVEKWPEWVTERFNLVGVCAACHDEHERAHRRIPFEALPTEVRLFVQNTGCPEAMYLHKTYPKREV